VNWLLRRLSPAPQGPAPVEELLLTDPPARVQLRRSARARRFTLSVSRLDGAARLTLPAGASLSEARDFLERQGGWLADALARTPPPRPLRPGDALPFRGAPVTLTVAGGPARVEGGRLIVPGAPADAARRARAFLKVAARDALAPAAIGHAATLGRTPSRIALRDTRSRWGSCSAAGGLSFSWRLVMAPPEVLDYVAAHEAAHLVEMNHSAAFWKLVARLRPDWRDQRAWLRAHGGALHRLHFDGVPEGREAEGRIPTP
jgi:predicted metal-dependent hydrolase